MSKITTYQGQKLIDIGHEFMSFNIPVGDPKARQSIIADEIAKIYSLSFYQKPTPEEFREKVLAFEEELNFIPLEALKKTFKVCRMNHTNVTIKSLNDAWKSFKSSFASDMKKNNKSYVDNKTVESVLLDYFIDEGKGDGVEKMEYAKKKVADLMLGTSCATFIYSESPIGYLEQLKYTPRKGADFSGRL